MEQTHPTHYRIEVYDDGPPPSHDSVKVSLCPGARKSRDPLANDLDQVTCRRCVELLALVGIQKGRRLGAE